jgi:hypothetical protein
VKIEILTDYPHVEKKSGGSKISGVPPSNEQY